MNETKIVIDPGHGGTDPGASGNGIVEKDLNLAISKYMYNRFRELGIPVKLTRDDDTTLSPSERTRTILDAYGNDPNVIVISNHINAGGGEGAEVIYALRNNSVLADLVLEEIGNTGQVLRETYQRRLPSNPSKDYYFIHRETGRTQPIIVEYGFLDTASDATRLKNNYEEYAEAVVKAVVEYLNLGYDKDESQNIYTVKSGDSLWNIAKKTGASVEEIKAANNLSSNLLNIGQKLVIPQIEVEQPGDYNVYTVKSGDNLYSIANRYNVSIDDLITYNNLSTTSLSIGQRLLIPIETQNNYQTYKVKAGDSLYLIANRYGTTIDNIKTLNNLNSDLLSVGQTLLIPTEQQNNNNYVVQSGDSLYQIARKFNTTVNELKSINNLTSNLLSVGQTLTIPSNISSNNYVVKSGDNLYSIARQYNTTVDEIKRKNNLSSNLLNIGQVLII